MNHPNNTPRPQDNAIEEWMDNHNLYGGHTIFILWVSINLLCAVQVYYATTAVGG